MLGYLFLEVINVAIAEINILLKIFLVLVSG